MIHPVVYTCILDGFDELRMPAQSWGLKNGQFVCFTNVPQMPTAEYWKYRPAYFPKSLNPHTAVRIHKMLPHLFFADATHSIWIDGHVMMKCHPQDLIDLLGDADIALFRHPARDCVYREIDLCLKENIGSPEGLIHSRSVLIGANFPEHAGLWAGGVIVRRHSPAINAFNRDWWINYATHSERDQITLPMVLLAHKQKGLKVVDIPGDILGKNQYVQVRSHVRHKDETILWQLAELMVLCGDAGVLFPGL